MNIKAFDFRQVAVYQKDIDDSIKGAIVFAVINNFCHCEMHSEKFEPDIWTPRRKQISSL
jgi:hypothetical protein